MKTSIATIALLVTAASAMGQLTTGDNQRWIQDDFDPNAIAPFNRFGHAVAACDFDGDGFRDLAIGAPGTDVLGVIEDAGAVLVAYGSASGLTTAGHQTLTQAPTSEDPPEQGDNFGWRLAAGDFDGDGFCDLAASAPFEDLDPVLAAGSIHVFAGSPGGLDHFQVWTVGTFGIQEVPLNFDFFGDELAAGDFDGDGFEDLAASKPENGNGGKVHVLFGTGSGLAADDNDLIYQGDPLGTWGMREAGDGFGASLAAGDLDGDGFDDLAVGAPGEDGIGVSDSGTVHLFLGASNGFEDRNQGQAGQSAFGETDEPGDLFGVSLAIGDLDGNGFGDLAIGSRESVGPAGMEEDSAGMVSIVYFPLTESVGLLVQTWTQDSPGVSDAAEAFDRFGEALAAGDFDGDGRDDLGIGVPGESFEPAGLSGNGAVHALYGTPAGLAAEREQYHGQGGWGGIGASEDLDYFGRVLAAGDFDADGAAALVVGVPEEDLSGAPDAGIAAVITGTSALIFADGFESGDTSRWSSTSP